MRKVMAQSIGAAMLAASLMIGPALLGPPSFTAARASCGPGDRIDATTALQAKKRAASAGYSQVRMEHKGCDNVWHGIGMKDGATGRVAVSPSGEVMPETTAEYMGVSAAFLEKARVTGLPKIPFIKLGRSVKYDLDVIDGFMAERCRLSTSAA